MRIRRIGFFYAFICTIDIFYLLLCHDVMPLWQKKKTMNGQNSPFGVLTGEDSVKVEHIITVPTATIATIIGGSVVIALFSAITKNLIK